jgi:hypothetical protein
MRVLDGVPHESQREKHIGLARRVRAVDGGNRQHAFDHTRWMENRFSVVLERAGDHRKCLLGPEGSKIRRSESQQHK